MSKTITLTLPDAVTAEEVIAYVERRRREAEGGHSFYYRRALGPAEPYRCSECDWTGERFADGIAHVGAAA